MIFKSPTTIIHGEGKASYIIEELKQSEIKSVLLVTDEGVYAAGVTKEIESNLEGANINYEVFKDIEIDPSTSTVERGYELIQEKNMECVIVVGGGSPICAAKGIALLSSNGGDIETYSGFKKATKPSLPLIALPTTAGSGGEVSPNFLLKSRAGNKIPFLGGYYPQLAILDPCLLEKLPFWQAICSSLDALSHAIEALLSPKATSFTDAAAFYSLSIMRNDLVKAAASNNNQSREQMLIASALANIACGNTSLGLVHATTYGLEQLSHGHACGLMLPFVLEFNLPVAKERMGEIAIALGLPPVKSNHPLYYLANETIEIIKELYTEIGFPDRIPSDVISRESINEIVYAVENNGKHMLDNNIRKANHKDLINLFERAFTGWKSEF